MTPEAKCKNRIKALLKLYGAYYTMAITGGFGNSGAPDFIGCSKGRYFAVEAKADTEVTKLQEKNLREIEAAGGRTFVVRLTSRGEASGFAELEAFLQE